MVNSVICLLDAKFPAKRVSVTSHDKSFLTVVCVCVWMCVRACVRVYVCACVFLQNVVASNSLSSIVMYMNMHWIGVLFSACTCALVGVECVR